MRYFIFAATAFGRLVAAGELDSRDSPYCNDNCVSIAGARISDCESILRTTFASTVVT